MKIKILTFNSEINYGANLQAFSLKEFLIKEGNSASIINYNRKPKYNKFLKILSEWFGKSPKNTILKFRKKISSISVKSRKKKLFKNFQIKYLDNSSTQYNWENINESVLETDLIIVGSDQVWSNEIVNDYDFPVYLLNFAKSSLKISYAASSGGDIFEEPRKGLVKTSLTSFDKIGVREKSLKFHLQKLGIKNIQWTPDPTFLIDWNKKLALENVNKENFLSVFVLADMNKRKTKKLIKQLKTSKEFNTSKLSDLSLKGIDPFDWIIEIKKSRILITDSYHAVLFAIYCKTPVLFTKWGESFNRDERVTSILEELNLNFLAVDGETLTLETINRINYLDWDIIDHKISELRLIGENFLKEIIK